MKTEMSGSQQSELNARNKCKPVPAAGSLSRKSAIDFLLEHNTCPACLSELVNGKCQNKDCFCGPREWQTVTAITGFGKVKGSKNIKLEDD